MIINPITAIVNSISKLFSKNVSIPIVNIESFGIDRNIIGNNNPNFFIKYYIASLDFEVTSLFKKYTKTVYLPILFNSEKPIKDLLAHYNNIFFEVKLGDHAWFKKVTGQLHISEIINLDKIYHKLYNDFKKDHPTARIDEFYINFYIKNYNNCTIGVCQHNKYYCLALEDIYNFISINNKTNCLELIKNNYKQYENIAVFDYFYVNELYIALHNENLELIINKIDEMNNEIKKKNQTINAMYSKKSFKLVES